MAYSFINGLPDIGSGIAEEDTQFKAGFVHLNVFDELSDRKTVFVSGRKGSGKSEMCLEFESRNSEKYSTILSLKQSALQYHSFQGIRRRIIADADVNGHDFFALSTHAWKLFLVVNLMIQICRKHSSSDSDVRTIRNYLSHNNWYSFEKDTAILNFIANILDLIFSNSFASGTMKAMEEFYFHGEGAQEAIVALQSWISRQEKPVLITLDDIDDEIGTINDEQAREAAVSFCESLIHAAYTLSPPRFSENLHLKLFFPEDLFMSNEGRQMDKYDARRKDVRWNNQALTSMICYRLRQNLSKRQFRDASDEDVWHEFFPRRISMSEFGIQTNRPLPSFGALNKYTLGRPRDLIKLCQFIFQTTGESKSQNISEEHVIAGVNLFSHYALSTLEREFTSRNLSIGDLMRSFTGSFRRVQRSDLVNKFTASGLCGEGSEANEAIDLLFEVGFLGVRKSLPHRSVNAVSPFFEEEYYFQNSLAEPRNHNDFVVHRCFMPALNIHDYRV